MSKSIIYAVNTSPQSLTVGDVINFGSIVRKYGCNLKLSGGNVVLVGAGYYDVDTNFTVTAGSAGTLVINLYRDGVLIPGAKISKTVEADSIYSFSIPATVKETCCCDSTLTAVLSGVDVTVTNATILVEKM